MSDKKENFEFQRYDYRYLHSAFIPSLITIFAEQNGSQSHLLVKEGDRVTEGQLIASGFSDTVPVHSPIPGTVCAVKSCTLYDGTLAESTVIRLEGSFAFEGKTAAGETDIAFLQKRSPYSIVSQIKEAGIINTFDNTSLAAALGRDTQKSPVLGVRLFDADPSCSVDSFVTEFFTKEVFEGALLCARSLKANAVVFFYDPKSFRIPDAAQTDRLFSGLPYFFIKTNKERYPAGSEQVLQKLTAKHAADFFKNTQAHVSLFIDSNTAAAAYRCLRFSLPLLDTIVEVNGSALHESKMFKVKIGTPLRRLVEECGGCESVPSKIIVNGLIQGTAVADLDMPVTKYLKTLTLLSSDSIPDLRTTQCINCGFCRSVCPMGIQPDRIFDHRINNTVLPDEILLSVHLCDNCALCNAACPARLPLHQTVSNYKEHPYAPKV